MNKEYLIQEVTECFDEYIKLGNQALLSEHDEQRVLRTHKALQVAIEVKEEILRKLQQA